MVQSLCYAHPTPDQSLLEWQALEVHRGLAKCLEAVAVMEIVGTRYSLLAWAEQVLAECLDEVVDVVLAVLLLALEHYDDQ